MPSLLFPILAAASALSAHPVLFHAGKRTYLQEDIKAGTVPKAAWNKFILGGSNFDLPAYRRGLYGAENLSGTSLYSLYLTLGGEEPWAMAVHLKPECVAKEKIFAGEFRVSDDPKRGGLFSKWYQAHREQYRALEKSCLPPPHNGISEWEEGAPYDLAKADPETQRLTKLCGPVLEDFFKDNDLRVVADPVNDDSWYIRDPSCIESIQGSPDEIVSLVAGLAEEEDGAEKFFGDSVRAGTYASGNVFLLLGAVAEAKLLGPNELKNLEKLARSQEPFDKGAFSFDRNADQPKILLALAQSLGRAKAAGTLNKFQAGISANLKHARAIFKKDCDGAKGVRDEKRKTCDRAHQEVATAFQRLFARF